MRSSVERDILIRTRTLATAINRRIGVELNSCSDFRRFSLFWVFFVSVIQAFDCFWRRRSFRILPTIVLSRHLPLSWSLMTFWNLNVWPNEMSVIKRDLYTSRNPIYTALYFILTVQFYGVLIFAGHVNEKGMWNILLVLGGKKLQWTITCTHIVIKTIKRNELIWNRYAKLLFWT